MRTSEDQHCICFMWKHLIRLKEKVGIIWQPLFPQLFLIPSDHKLLINERADGNKEDEKYNFNRKPKFLGRYHWSNWALLIHPVELFDSIECQVLVKTQSWPRPKVEPKRNFNNVKVRNVLPGRKNAIIQSPHQKTIWGQRNSHLGVNINESL